MSSPATIDPQERAVLEARLAALQDEVGAVRAVHTVIHCDEPDSPDHPTFRSLLPTGDYPPRFVLNARLAMLDAEVRSTIAREQGQG